MQKGKKNDISRIFAALCPTTVPMKQKEEKLTSQVQTAQVSNPAGGKYGCQDDPARWYCPASVQPLVALFLVVAFVSAIIKSRYHINETLNVDNGNAVTLLNRFLMQFVIRAFYACVLSLNKFCYNT